MWRWCSCSSNGCRIWRRRVTPRVRRKPVSMLWPWTCPCGDRPSVQRVCMFSTGHEGVQERAEYVRQALIKARSGSDDPAKMALEVFQMAGPPYFGLMETAWTLELVTRHATKSSKHMARFGALVLHLDALLSQLLNAPLRYWPTLARTPAEKAYYYDTVEPMTQEAVQGFSSCLQLLVKALSRLDQVTALHATVFRKIDTMLQRLLRPKTKSEDAREKWNQMLRKETVFRTLVPTLETLVTIGMFSDQLLLSYGNLFRTCGKFSNDCLREITLSDLSRLCRSLCIARFWPEPDEAHQHPGLLQDESLGEFWNSATHVLLEQLQGNQETGTNTNEDSKDTGDPNDDEVSAYDAIATKVWSKSMATEPWGDDDMFEDTDTEESSGNGNHVHGTWEEYYAEARTLARSSVDEELEERQNAIREFAKDGFITNLGLIAQDDSLDISTSGEVSERSLKAALARIHIIRLSLKYASHLPAEAWERIDEKRLRDSSSHLYKLMSPRKVTTYQKNVMLKMLQVGNFKPVYFDQETVAGLKCALVWPLNKVGVDVDAAHRCFKPIAPGANIEWISSRSDARKEQERQAWLQRQSGGSLEGFDPIALLGTGRANLSQLSLTATKRQTSQRSNTAPEVKSSQDIVSIRGRKEDQLITHLLPPTLKKSQETRGIEAAEISYYRARTGVPLPPTRLKQKILENARWTFVLLPFESWQSISSSRRAQYLQMLLPQSLKQANKR
eukprot:gb/GECG01005141.1/.p1 GENE.gb/GECG01005141.1/~~gb/GECG01005141.1/.p1  ORF type:complete len:730 (+),score=94.12 gb/GECG01005141.1/:1-2190(+)